MTEFLQEITFEPGDSFYTGTDAAEEVIDYSLPISLAGRGFLLDRTQQLPAAMRHSRQSIDLLNTQNASDASEQTSAPPEVWRRTVESWHQGAGQSRFDRVNALPYRFSDSYNVDVWDEWQVTLLNDTSNILNLPAGKSHVTTVGPDRFVVVVGNQSWWFTDTALPPVTLALPQQTVDICSDGESLYILNALGQITRYTGPAAGTVVSTVPNFDQTRALLTFVKGFIVAGTGKYLYDMTTGSPTLIYQHPLNGFTWVDACEGLSPVYLIGGMGDKWHVYAMTVNEDGATFDPPISAAPIPEGEIGYSLGSYLGYVLIGTNSGWRFGFPASDGTITFGRLVETANPVRCFEGQDRFVWYGQTSDTDAGLGRADLSQFVAPMTPAYASDLRAGLAGQVSGVITFGTGAESAGKRVFTIDGVGVFAESAVLAEDGWIEQGEFTFNSADPKMAMYLQVTHGSLPLGASLSAQVRYDSSGWAEVGRQETGGTLSLGNLSLGTLFNASGVRIELSRATNPTQGPSLQRIEYRALNVPGRATEFRLPIILRANMYYNERQELRDPADDYAFLEALWLERRQVKYREAGTVYTIHITDFLWLPEQMNENGSAYEGLMVLTGKEMR